ncbi:MAG TPA: VacJ family lipoprotein [Gammaproteobacteria bacterium]|nr:VacJ family lipoprotein [Gammaproteobacteria bacterium]
MSEPGRPPGRRAARWRPCRSRQALLGLVALVLAGCAAAPTRPGAPDPVRGFNKRMFAFNNTMDRLVLKPVSNAYIKVTPKPVRTGVTNFFRNLGYPYVAANDLLQGRVQAGVETVDAFFWNTTVGIGGLFDVGGAMGLKPLEQNFGATAGVWGVNEGAYLVLPLIGPSSLRALPGIPLEIFSSPLYYTNSTGGQVAAKAVETVNTRARLRAQIQRVNEALDPYAFLRSAYRQRQNYLIRGGRESSGQELLEELNLPPGAPKPSAPPDP